MKRCVANAVFIHRGELRCLREKECGANEVAPYHFDESMGEILKLVSYCRGSFYAARIMRSMIGYQGGRHHFFMFIRVVVRFSQTEKILLG